MEEPFPARTQAVLKQLGWFESNQRFSEADEKKLVEMGYRVSGAARQFLQRFGTISWFEKNPYQNAYDKCHTDPIQAASVCCPPWIAKWQEQVGAQLCPIGEVGYGSFLLTMDEHGRVFGANQEGVLSFFADDGLELIEMLFGTGGGPKWPVDEQDRWTGDAR